MNRHDANAHRASALGGGVDDERREAAAKFQASTPRELFDTLVRGHAVDASGGRAVLTEAERAAVLVALGAVPSAARDALLDERIAGQPSDRERCVALELLGHVGGDRDIQRLVAWAQQEDPDVRVPRSVQVAFRRSLAVLLKRHPGAAREAAARYKGAHLSLLPGFVAAMGAVEHPSGLDALAHTLGSEERFDAHVLAEMGVVARGARFAPSAAVAARVRRYLSSPQPTVRAQALAATVALGDMEAVEDLIDLLELAPPMESPRLAGAIAELTGEHFGRDAEAWRRWHVHAKAKWEQKGGRLLTDALHGEPDRAARAIKELAAMRIHRDEIIGRLAPALSRPEPELVVLALASMGHLGSQRATAHLLRGLEDTRLEVQRAAYLALRRITGQNHGDQASAWRAAGWGNGPH